MTRAISREWFQDSWMRETFGKVMDECIGIEETLMTETMLEAAIDFLQFCATLNIKKELGLFGIRTDETIQKIEDGKIVDVIAGMSHDNIKKLIVYYNFELLENARKKINSRFTEEQVPDKGKEKVQTIDLEKEEDALKESFKGNILF